MKALTVLIFAVILSVSFSFPPAAARGKERIGEAVTQYFAELFGRLREVAQKAPDKDNFRQMMRPAVEETDGVYGATLISPDFVIRQVYYHSHFLARGFDLKKVKELKNFYRMMKEHPAPQLSEPGHGGLLQPRLIAMRYPVVKGGKLKSIVSMMVRTKSFLRATGLDKSRAFEIICLGKLAEKKGRLSENYKEAVLKLPSTEWVIRYDE